MESQSLQAILRLQSNTLSQEQHLCSVRPSMMKNYMMDNSQLGLLLVLSTTSIIAYHYTSLSLVFKTAYIHNPSICFDHGIVLSHMKTTVCMCMYTLCVMIWFDLLSRSFGCMLYYLHVYSKYICMRTCNLGIQNMLATWVETLVLLLLL